MVRQIRPTEQLNGWIRWVVILCAGLLPVVTWADVLIGTNEERFVGTVIEETPDSIVFDSELGGRLTVPRAKIREVLHTLPSATGNSTDWKPPGIGHDGCDWVQLKSGEWLRGWLKYVQDKKVEFDSDELDEMTLNLKDVHKIYPAKPMFAQFEDREAIRGMIVVSNDVVFVSGAESVELPRTKLIGITPGGKRTGIKNWSGKFVAGVNVRSGNTKSTDTNLSGELARRTPNTDLEFDYLGNFAEVDGNKNENNQRVDVSLDIRLNRRFFVRPVLAEYFHDPLANIDARVTGGVGVGYYIFDEDTLEWRVLTGPAFQYTRFTTVDVGQSDHSSTPAGVLYSYFKADITKRIKTATTYQGTVTSSEAGLYSHHAVFDVEFEIKRHLDLDISFIWDYLENPQQESNGTVPDKSDLRLTLGLGVRF